MKKILTILAMLGLGLSLQLGCEFDDDDDDWDNDDDIDMGVLSSPQDDYGRGDMERTGRPAVARGDDDALA